MKYLIELTAKAKEIYDLGVRMQETFGTNPETQKEYMIMAIAAGLQGVYNNQPLAIEDNFGEQIKRLRAEKKLTLKQVEDATGISNAYLSQLETGKIKKPSHDTVIKLITFLTAGKSNKFDFGMQNPEFNPLVPGSGLKGL